MTAGNDITAPNTVVKTSMDNKEANASTYSKKGGFWTRCSFG